MISTINNRHGQTYFDRNWSRISMFLSRFRRLFIFKVTGLFPAERAVAKRDALVYDVTLNGKAIGTINVHRLSAGRQVQYKLQSSIHSDFIFPFKAKSKEETILENGIITYSYLHSRINGMRKARNKMLRVGDGYELHDGGSIEKPEFTALRSNELSLYMNEPVRLSRIYSDKYRQFIIIGKIAEHSYRLIFPDGKYSHYHYKDGLCTSIDMHSLPYGVKIQLRK